MATTVADILGKSKFDIDAASRSLPGGRPNGTGNADDSIDGNSGDVSPDHGGTRSDQAGHTEANPADARASEPADDGNRSSRGNSRRASNRRTDASASNRRTDKETEIDLSEFLLVAHSLFARAISANEFEISPMEAKVLGGAIKRVLKHLPKLVKMTPMQEAISGLLAIAVVMYLPRYFRYAARTGGPVVDAQQQKQPQAETPAETISA